MIFGCRKLPSKNGDIDWDVVCEDYFGYILSPFAPEMVSPDRDGKIRNLILGHLKSIPENDLAQMDVLDFGCGPGNLIPHVSDKINNLVGLDTSARSIEVAKKVASNYRAINFEGICSNILDVNTEKKYDLIISSNSILPKTRKKVHEVYAKLRELLRPNGKIVAILPSFDTTVYLRSLREEYYRGCKISAEQVTGISRAFTESKLMDDNTLTYADDGDNIQCYHTRESIIEETRRARLRLVRGPEKLYYPWDLTRKFDYGYFPSAAEEIWDWFIVAVR